jgi:hypothetical protein
VTRREENVADVHANTELEIPLCPEILLNLHGAAYGVDRGRECRHGSVAGSFEPFAVVASCDSFDYCLCAVDQVERMLLVRPHQGRKTDHVGNHDSG